MEALNARHQRLVAQSDQQLRRKGQPRLEHGYLVVRYPATKRSHEMEFLYDGAGTWCEYDSPYAQQLLERMRMLRAGLVVD